MLPIRIRQFPRYVAELVTRIRLLRRQPKRPPVFHLCFFSCRSHFPYLYCSIHSILRVRRDLKLRLVVFEDENQSFSASQVDALQTLAQGIEVITWPHSEGWGAEQIQSIWRAYAHASTDAASEDFIVKVDSDVFFFSDRIFRLAERSSADLIGDGHYVGFKYCQGGCYFVRASAVDAITSLISGRPLNQVLHPIEFEVEDIIAWQLAGKTRSTRWLSFFMMFPDEVNNLGGIGRYAKWKFSCAHFTMKNKAAMLEVYERDLLTAEEREPFRSMLSVE